MDRNDCIRFGDLSPALKTFIVLGWIAISWIGVLFITGLIMGIVDGFLGVPLGP